MNKENEYNHFSETDYIAKLVSKWTKEAGTMLPKSPEDIKNFLENGDAVVYWLEYRGYPNPVGFGAVTFQWPKNWIELGGVVVDKKYQGRGIGHKIVERLIDLSKSKYGWANIFALCNDKSLKLFLDNGAEIMKNPEILPKQVFEECVNCPKFLQAKAQGQICCDIPVLIHKAPKNEALGCCR